MGSDPNFRLKAFAVIAGVLGVFLVTFVAQRAWYWLKTRRREDVDTSRVEPIVDFGLLGLGAIIIWLSVEGLLLSISMTPFKVQSFERQKIAEIEVGMMNTETNKLTLLYYPVDEAGNRQTAFQVLVFTTGQNLEIEVELMRWRGLWEWLGERGFYQVNSLVGYEKGRMISNPGRLDAFDKAKAPRPESVAAYLFLRGSEFPKDRTSCTEGAVFEVFLDSATVEVVPKGE
ncbi:MAG: hypothetical protein OEY28_11055 [Nitrospira sp.]|nr:hypothetical protein [Nitrospira sp.]